MIDDDFLKKGAGNEKKSTCDSCGHTKIIRYGKLMDYRDPANITEKLIWLCNGCISYFNKTIKRIDFNNENKINLSL
jgi:ribosomal protein L37AE/L43A